MSRERISQKQVEEWVDNPVTRAFKFTAIYERDEILRAQGLEAFHPFQPERTQEILANINGATDTWDVVIAALEGEGIMEQEDGSDGIEDAILE